MGVGEVVVVGYLGATASQETLDEVGGFDVEAEAGKPLSMSWLMKLKKTGNVEHESCGFEASAPSVVDVLR